jgi:hypothetical protein
MAGLCLRKVFNSYAQCVMEKHQDKYFHILTLDICDKEELKIDSNIIGPVVLILK